MSRRIEILVLVMAALVVGACDESVQPVIQTDRPFTLYGYLNPLADTQAVRLYTIDGRLERTRPEPVDADMQIDELTTGNSWVLRDSIVQYASANYGFVFWSSFRPDHEETYRVTASRSDGASVTATVRTPPISTAEVLPTGASDFLLPVPVRFRNAPNLIDITATYVTDAGSQIIKYGVEQMDDPDGRIVELQFRRDTRQILLDALLLGQADVKFSFIRLRVVVTNPEWTPPGGFFDREVLVEPGTFSNVENGFGFVGAGYPLTFEFTPDDAVLAAAGFVID